MHMCVLVFSVPCEEKGSSTAVIMPWLKMMTCLGLVADFCIAGVFSQGSKIMTQSFEDLRPLLVVVGRSLFFCFLCVCVCVCAC